LFVFLSVFILILGGPLFGSYSILTAIGALLLLSAISLQFMADANQIAIFDIVGIGAWDVTYNISYYASGWLKRFGIGGIKSWDGPLRGDLKGLSLVYDPLIGIVIYQAISGFIGLKISLNDDTLKKSYFGTALYLKIDDTP
jgi:hypothetical protein